MIVFFSFKNDLFLLNLIDLIEISISSEQDKSLRPGDAFQCSRCPRTVLGCEEDDISQGFLVIEMLPRPKRPT